MRAATEGSLPPVIPQGNLVEVLGREVRQGSPGELMVESTPSRQRRPPCKSNKEMSDEAAEAAALTYLLTWAMCVLRLHPATPGMATRCGCVCLGSGFGCAPPLLAGVFGCVRAPLAPSHCCHGCAVWVCVFGLGFRLGPATPGWGVGLCTCSACTQPLLARVRGVGVCIWARFLAAPRHSWLGCWAVCVLRLHPAIPGRSAWCGCVCLSSGFGCAPPLLVGVLGRLHAPLARSHSWHGCALWVCVFGLGFRLPPCHSWLGCWAVCVLRLHPATPGPRAYLVLFFELF